MLKKTLHVLKDNPVLIVLYIAYIAAAMLITELAFPMYPVGENPLDILLMFCKIGLGYLLLCAVGLLFFAGYGHMLSEAVVHGKSSLHGFLPGIKKFFVRVLVAALLQMAFYIGVTIAISIIMIPITIIFVVSSAGDPMQSVSVISTIFMAIIFLLMLFALPFVLLWYPAIFIDDINTIEALKKGARAGAKAYWKLVLAIFIIYIPLFVYFAIDNPFKIALQSTYGHISYSPAYYIFVVTVSLLSMVLLFYTFTVYEEIRHKLGQLRP
ncbi:MAG: hypothetical protein ACOX7R_02775 [Acetivibrionales bacterium]